MRTQLDSIPGKGTQITDPVTQRSLNLEGTSVVERNEAIHRFVAEMNVDRAVTDQGAEFNGMLPEGPAVAHDRVAGTTSTGSGSTESVTRYVQSIQGSMDMIQLVLHSTTV